MPLATRKPTGRPAWPFLLVEGEEKSGKSYTLAQAAADERIGRAFMLDLADGALDEYAPLGDYEILVHDGTWSSMMGQIKAAAAEPSDPNLPNLIGLDAGTLLWGLQKDRASFRARNSRRALAILKEDPDAEIDVSMNYWNEAKDRWAELLRVLRTFPGIAVMTAHGREVTKVDASGQPTREHEWSTEVEKTTPAAASAIIRLRRPHRATLVGIRKLGVEIPPQGLALPDQHVIAHVVFDVLMAGVEGFGVRAAVEPQLGIARDVAKGRVMEAVARTIGGTEVEQKSEAARVWRLYVQGEPTEVSADTLAEIISEIGRPPEEPPAQEPQDAPGAPPAPEATPEPPSPPADESGADPAESVATVPVTYDEAAVRSMKKPELVAALLVLGLPTSGNMATLQGRLIEAGRPFEQATASNEGTKEEPPLVEALGGTLVGPDGEDLPEVRDIPDGWVEEECYCGEPVIYEKGLMTATIVHLDPALDVEHKAASSF